MSQQEQDRELGRLMRELRSCETEIGAIEANLSRLAEGMQAASRYISDALPPLSQEPLLRAKERLLSLDPEALNPAAIAKVMTELEKLYGQRSELKRKIAAMGF